MKKTYKLDGEICANCASRIEHKIEKLDGVNNASVSALMLKFTLDADDEKFDSLLSDSIKIFGKIEPDCKLLV